MGKTYFVQNSAMQTTAAPVKQPTGTAIRTMMQLAPQSSPSSPLRIVAWGFSFDGSAAATPGQVELIDTGTVFATMSTAYAAADIMSHNDPNAPANTAGTGGVPLGLGTALSGFATAAVTEGSITSVRTLDLLQAPPTAPYAMQFPLGYYPEIPGGHSLRVRVTFAVTVNMYIWMLLEAS